MDEDSIGLNVYNELDVTEQKIEKSAEIMVKGTYYETGEDSIPAIHSKEIDKNQKVESTS